MRYVYHIGFYADGTIGSHEVIRDEPITTTDHVNDAGNQINRDLELRAWHVRILGIYLLRTEEADEHGR